MNVSPIDDGDVSLMTVSRAAEFAGGGLTASAPNMRQMMVVAAASENRR